MKVLIVDDNQLIRTALVTLLSNDGGFELIVDADDGLIAVEKARELRCDLVLMDISLKGMSGFTATRLIRDFLPQCKVLFVTNYVNAGVIEEALKTGACGYVAKTDVIPDLKRAIAAVSRGEYFLSRSCAELLPQLPVGESRSRDDSRRKSSIRAGTLE